MRAGVRAFSLWLLAGSAMAAGLGEVEVDSTLGEPFSAQVKVRIDDVERPDFDVRVGTSEEYDRLGLPRPSVIGSIAAGAVREGPDGWYVDLRGAEPVRELVLDLILIIDKPGARQLRHYPILLDFAPTRPDRPEQTTQPSPRPQPEERAPAPQRERPAPPPRTIPQTRPAPARESIEGAESYEVVPGDTLYGIARRVNTGQGVHATAERIFELNPQAFSRNDMNLLLAGATLQLPGAMAAQPAPEPQQEQEVPVAATTRAPEQPQPRQGAPEEDRVELTVPPPTEEIAQSLGQWEEADEGTLAQNSERAGRDLSFARAELETYRNENERLQERVDILEQRIADMQRLIELRDAELARRGEEDPGGIPGGDRRGDAASEGFDAPATPPPQREPDPVAVEEASLDGRDIALYVGGALLVVLAIFIFYMHRREAAVKEQARQDLRDRIEHSRGVTLPDDL